MKKTFKIILSLIILLGICTISLAADVRMELDLSKTEVQRQEEVKLEIKMLDFTRNGENKAVEARIEYDSSKLTVKSVSWENGWSGVADKNTAGRIGIAANKTGEVNAEEVIAEVVFTVNENAELGNTDITASNVLTSADGDEIEVRDTETTLNIKEPDSTEEKIIKKIKIATPPTKTEYTEGEKFNTSGMKVVLVYSDNTEVEIEDYSVLNGKELEVGQKEVLIKYTDGDKDFEAVQEIEVKEKESNSEDNKEEKEKTDSKDDTVADRKNPNAGAEKLILPVGILLIITGFAFILYVRNKNI